MLMNYNIDFFILKAKKKEVKTKTRKKRNEFESVE